MSNAHEPRSVVEYVAAGLKTGVLVCVLGLIGLAANHTDVTSPESSAIGKPGTVVAPSYPGEPRSFPAA